MRHLTLQTLTWGTIAGATASALWLAAHDRPHTPVLAVHPDELLQRSPPSTGPAPAADPVASRPPAAGPSSAPAR